MTDTYIPYNARPEHLYISGKPGVGKSSLIHFMALQDIELDPKAAVIVLDPNGDLVNQLIHWIPENREADTIYLDGLNGVSLDFLYFDTPTQRGILANDITTVLKRLEPGWGSRMDSILQWTAQTILYHPAPAFTDIYYILLSESYRKQYLENITTQTIHDYWNFEFKKLPKNSETPITTRMSTFILSPPIKALLGDRHPRLRIRDILRDHSVLLADLNQIGEAGQLLGSLIFSQIQQAAFRRPKSNRPPIYLYIDEFQDMTTSGFNSKTLAQSRKFNLCLTLAHHHPHQIPDLINDVKGCISSYLFFQMDADHARVFSSQIRPYKPEDIESLEKFTALYHPASGPTKIIPTPYPPPHTSDVCKVSYAESIRKRTVEKYGCDTRTDVVSLEDGNNPGPQSEKPDPEASDPPDVPPHQD